MGFAIKLVGFGALLGAGMSFGQVVSLPEAPLLPQSFGEWKTAPAAGTSASFSLAGISKAALEECGPERSAVGDFARAGKTVHIEAIQFGDRSGAYSAFTLAERLGMKQGSELGTVDSVGQDTVLFTVGSSVVLVGGATASDVASLTPLAAGLPKVSGNKGVAPLLPSLVPEKGLVGGSLRYALGASTYAADGGVLPANSLGWDKSAEAVTAKFDDKRGKETLTMLLYPTPMIAGMIAKRVQDGVAGMGPEFAQAKVRREGNLILLAEGTFFGDEAQKMLENIHMRKQLSFDQDVQPVFHTEVMKTFTLMQSIAVFCLIGCTAAVVLGFALGFGRAAIRVMQGKPAAKEIEFLSLHLAPQNKPAHFGPGGEENQPGQG